MTAWEPVVHVRATRRCARGWHRLCSGAGLAAATAGGADEFWECTCPCHSTRHHTTRKDRT